MTIKSNCLFEHAYAIVTFTTVNGDKYTVWCNNQEQVDEIQMSFLFDPTKHITFSSVTYSYHSVWQVTWTTLSLGASSLTTTMASPFDEAKICHTWPD